MSKFIQYLYNQALALSQLNNSLLGGDPDDSLSGRCGRAVLSGRPKWFVHPIRWYLDTFFLLVFNKKDHCINSVEVNETYDKEVWSWSKD